MFQAETEDMLPRQAPRPCTPLGLNEDAAKPVVPEVSILFGHQAGNVPGTVLSSIKTAECQAAQQIKTATQPTYAAWKKQVLPKVTFPPQLNSPPLPVTKTMDSAIVMNGSNEQNIQQRNCGVMEYNVQQRSNVYPLRTVVVNPTTTSVAAAAPISAASYQNQCGDTLEMQYRRSMENVTNAYTAAAAAATTTASSSAPFQLQRRSLDAISLSPAAPIAANIQTAMPIAPSSSSSTDILTICAGTQTDANNNRNDSPTTCSYEMISRHFATKQDIEKIVDQLKQMRGEQMRLTEHCEALLKLQQEQQKQYQELKAKHRSNQKDIATQCDTINGVLRDFDYDNGRESPGKSAAFYQKPVAQSTTYRANTFRSNQQQQHQQQQQNLNNGPTVLPNPITEKSLVMNELALKYLPNDKLNALMRDFTIQSSAPLPSAITATTTPTRTATSATTINAISTNTTPLRNIENLDKSPCDISNASYKYLKKYRLLPEDHESNTPNACYRQKEQQPPTTTATLRNINTPCNRIPTTASTTSTLGRNLQQQPQTQLRSSASTPLLNSTPSPACATEQVFDFEHLRRQRKFL